MTQGELFPRKEPQAKPTCGLGGPWLDHFSAPIGTGKGCDRCGALGYTRLVTIRDN